jgi:S-adenosylmethionine decarboxylase
MDTFEGPEKRLSIIVDGIPDGSSIEYWTEMLNIAGCKIINIISNSDITAYLLSESSLFVFKDGFMLKTCGTTTPLSILKQISSKLIRSITYSHRHFFYPLLQPTLHRNFLDEIDVIGNLGKSQKHSYSSFDYYTTHVSGSPFEGTYLEVMMEGLSNSEHFHEDAHPNKEALRKESKIDLLFDENVKIDDWLFEPHGYSCNTILDQFYSTIHITPEGENSYASYETNDIRNALNKIGICLFIFKPKEWCACLVDGGNVNYFSHESWKREAIL